MWLNGAGSRTSSIRPRWQPVSGSTSSVQISEPTKSKAPTRTWSRVNNQTATEPKLDRASPALLLLVQARETNRPSITPNKAKGSCVKLPIHAATCTMEHGDSKKTRSVNRAAGGDHISCSSGSRLAPTGEGAVL